MKPAINTFKQPMMDRRRFILGGAFAGAAGLAAWRQPREHLDYLGNDKLDRLVPTRIGPWQFVASSGLVVPPKDQLQDAIYSQLLTRVYSDQQNPPIMLLLAQSHGETGFLQIHRPETCYTAGGYQIVNVQRHDVRTRSKIIRANSVDATADDRTEHIVYWTRIGNQMPLSWTQQKLAVAEQNLRGVIPDAILVRVSCIVEDAAVARSNIDAFIRALIGAIPADRRSVFVI